MKTLYSIRNLFSEKIKILLFNALVLSQLQVSSVLLNRIAQNVKTTSEKRPNWGTKASFHSIEFKSSSDLKMEPKKFIDTIFVILENELLILEMEKITFFQPIPEIKLFYLSE